MDFKIGYLCKTLSSTIIIFDWKSIDIKEYTYKDTHLYKLWDKYLYKNN